MMDLSIHIDTISMGEPIVHFKGSQVEFLNYDVCLSLTFIVNNADPALCCISSVSSQFAREPI